MSTNGYKKDQLDPLKGEVPPDAETEALEPGTLVFENPTLAKGFTSVPNYILRDPSISIGAKSLFSLFLSYAWQEGSCFPGQQRIARELGLSDRHIRRFLTELVERGLVKIKRRGLGKTNIYIIRNLFLPHEAKPKADRTRVSDQERTPDTLLDRTPVSYNEDSEYKDTVEKDSDISNSRDQQSSFSGKTRSHAKTPSNGRGGSENEGEGADWSGNIAQIMGDLTKFDLHDLEDPANVYRNPKRVMKLWRKSGLSEEDFIPLLYEAKKITLQHSGSIRKNAGESRSTKNRAPYFFGVLNNLIAAKQVEKLEEKRKEALAKTQGGFVKRMSP